MSEWEFLFECDEDELLDTMMNGGTDEDFDFIEEQEKKQRQSAWKKRKILRDTNQISRAEFRK